MNRSDILLLLGLFIWIFVFFYDDIGFYCYFCTKNTII